MVKNNSPPKYRAPRELYIRIEALLVMSVLDKIAPIYLRFSEKHCVKHEGWGCSNAVH
jgi:hypothetical protein